MKRGFTLIELLIVIAIIAILAAIAVPNFLEAQTRAKVSRVKADQRSLATGLEAYYVDNNSYPAWSCGGVGAVCSDAYNWTTYQDEIGHANAFAGENAGAAKIHSFRVHTEEPWETGAAAASNQFFSLTTPISYVTSWFVDPFAATKASTYGYYAQKTGWIVYSYGPDADETGHVNADVPGDIEPFVEKESVYNYHVANPQLMLLVGGPGLSYTNADGWSPPTDFGSGAFTYDPTNGTGSEGDVYRCKQ